MHFTGKHWDSESNLDDFGARYYSSGMARWITPDWSARQEAVPYVDLGNPQSLNLYAYVGNNPTTDTDASGHDRWSQAQQNGGCWFQKTEACDGEAFSSTSNDVNSPSTDSPDQATAQNSDPTAPPSPSTPDPAGVRTDPSLNPSNNNSSAKDTPTDQTHAPIESRGQQPKGERRTTRKPEFKDKGKKLPKGVRPKPDKPGEYQVKNPHTGNWVDKPKGWSPVAQKVGVGAVIVGVAAVVAKAVVGCFGSGFCELGFVF
jgi:RHS repeat-associated protein